MTLWQHWHLNYEQTISLTNVFASNIHARTHLHVNTPTYYMSAHTNTRLHTNTQARTHTPIDTTLETLSMFNGQHAHTHKRKHMHTQVNKQTTTMTKAPFGIY